MHPVKNQKKTIWRCLFTCLLFGKTNR